MKKVVVAATMLSLLAGMGASVAKADPEETMTVCHHPGEHQKTKEINKKSWDPKGDGTSGHAGHGDTVGPCGELPPDDDDDDDDDGDDHDGLCEAVLDRLTELAPDEVAALLDVVAYAELPEILEALAVVEVAAEIDLEDLLEEITDGVCEVLDLVFHIKHRVLGVAFFATGHVLDLAGHVTHKALHVVGSAAGAVTYVAGGTVHHAVEHVADGVFVGLDVAIYDLFDVVNVDASAGAFIGLL